ncbi:hypothetical protein [Algoriphagus confluentis]|uniref:Uncharacterized protein n=1 Tax=Algoriphagus confluentis TaxID=1697556 RepID=A0ABQ6PJQ5_9BACT|nr:hypothetical protein Aconfl_08260 [Algoriphagus confluentis]
MSKLKNILLASFFVMGVFFFTTSKSVGSNCPAGNKGLCIYVNGAPASCGNAVGKTADCKPPSDEELG